MKKKILQKIGDEFIMKPLRKALDSDDTETFNTYIEIGYWYDDFCTGLFNVYLD